MKLSVLRSRNIARLIEIALLVVATLSVPAFADSVPDDENVDLQKVLQFVRTHACADRIQPNEIKQDHLEAEGCVECEKQKLFEESDETTKKLKKLVVAVDAASDRNRAKRDLEFYESSVFKENIVHAETTDPAELAQKIKVNQGDQVENLHSLKSKQEALANCNATIAVLSNYPSDGKLDESLRKTLNLELLRGLDRVDAAITGRTGQIENANKLLEKLHTKVGPSVEKQVQNLQARISQAQKVVAQKKMVADAMSAILSPEHSKQQLGDKIDLVRHDLESSLEDQQSEIDSDKDDRSSLLADEKRLNLLLAKATEQAKSNKSPSDQDKLNEFEEAARKKIATSPPGFNPCGMSPAEVAALQFYTGSGYQPLNKALRQGSADVAKYKPTVEVLKSALSKLRRYNGLVRRGSTLPPEVIDQYKVGSTVVFKQFTSTSLSGGFDGNAKFIIHSKAGRYIGALSTASSENEVLFPPEARFKVLSRTDNDGNSEFVLEEFDEKVRPGTAK